MARRFRKQQGHNGQDYHYGYPSREFDVMQKGFSATYKIMTDNKNIYRMMNYDSYLTALLLEHLDDLGLLVDKK